MLIQINVIKFCIFEAYYYTYTRKILKAELLIIVWELIPIPTRCGKV